MKRKKSVTGSQSFAFIKDPIFPDEGSCTVAKPNFSATCFATNVFPVPSMPSIAR